MNLKRNYEVYIIAGPNHKKKIIPLRQLKADRIGNLIHIKCTVVRISDVKPLI